jgi:pyruvate formate lyase activating enzyme
MTDVPPTPHATLTRARAIAKRAGLRHVYLGNVHDRDGDTTRCTGCDEPLIVRDWYRILDYRLDPQGRCRRCQTALAGRFDAACGTFGRRRIPLRISG